MTIELKHDDQLIIRDIGGDKLRVSGREHSYGSRTGKYCVTLAASDGAEYAETWLTPTDAKGLAAFLTELAERIEKDAL